MMELQILRFAQNDSKIHVVILGERLLERGTWREVPGAGEG